MWRPTRAIFLLIVSVFFCGASACSSVDRSPAPPLEPISVTDIKAVAGTWEGIMVRSPAIRSNDWVTLTIEEDGMFQFTSLRTIGIFSGDGQFTVEEGKLIARSERGQIAAQLHRYVGQDNRVLIAEGTAGDGLRYRAQLRPKRP